MSGQATGQRDLDVCAKISAAVAAFNAAAREAADLGLRIEVGTIPLQTMSGGEARLLEVSVSRDLLRNLIPGTMRYGAG